MAKRGWKSRGWEGRAELDEGGFSDVDSPSTTDPPASSPALRRAAWGGMKDE